METWSKNIDINALAAEYGTPHYVLNPTQIAANFAKFVGLVGSAEQVVFPIKANPSLPILREICKLGGSVSVASNQEFFLARLAGIEADQCHYNTPAPELKRGLSLVRDGAAFVIDSAEILAKADAELAGEALAGRIFLRLNSDLPIHSSTAPDVVLPGHNSDAIRKFGIRYERIVELLKHTKSAVSGLHFHVGPQIDKVEVFIGIVETLHTLADEIEAHTAHKITHINLGGGLGIPFLEGENYPSIDELSAGLQAYLRDSITYFVEPGRSLIGDAAGVITKVTSVKLDGDKTWGIVDMGSRDLDRIATTGRPHQIVDAAHRALATDGPDTLSGSLCFSDDTFLPATQLAGVKEGDVLFIKHCGAYSYQAARQFDGPQVKGAVKVLADGQTAPCLMEEEEILNPTYTTFMWEHDFEPSGEPELVDPARVKALNSAYLQYTSASDAYEIVATNRVAHNLYEVDLDVSSEVDFISMPFATRMAADTSIMAALEYLGIEKKEFPVWADRLYLDASVNMKPNRVMRTRISLSPYGGKGQVKVILARFTMDDNRFSGFFRFKFRLE